MSSKKNIKNNYNKKKKKENFFIRLINRKNNLNSDELKKISKKFSIIFLIWLSILAIGLVTKTLQNDTFYTIKIGKLILDNGIDMLDHFSWHQALSYTYPHWLYDVFIYLIFKLGGLPFIYISSIVLLIILLIIVFMTNKKVSKSTLVSAFATFICSLAISGFVTARAQLVSFIVFALEIYFIEAFLKEKKNRYLVGLFILSLVLCNIHVAVWIFYYILFLPYLAEYIISSIMLKIKKKNKVINLLNKKVIFEKNNNIKYLIIVFILSPLTGLLTPIGDTPYTYLYKTMIGNSQDYIQEHQMLSLINSPFTIIIALETIILSILGKVKLRDFFMICGLIIMSIVSTRHLSFLALIGTICFARVFENFLIEYDFIVDEMLLDIFVKKKTIIITYAGVILISGLLFWFQQKSDYVDKELYPVEAVKYIKENINIDEMHLFNDYNFGSYLLYNDIPVFIDSRADLYTKPFSGFEYDIFDDYEFIGYNYQVKFEFYKITHVLLYKNNNQFYDILAKDDNYELLYDDDNFGLFEKIGTPKMMLSFNKE